MISVPFSLRHFILSSIVTVAALVFFVAGSGTAHAAPAGLPSATVELDGYLWSDNIGWVSLNCKTGGTDGPDAGVLPEDICGTSNYKVILTNSTGLLSGYGWSNNIGWIKFNGLSGYPTVAENLGTSAVSARATGDLSDGDLKLAGWVRACAGTISPSICTDMTNSAVSGGWNGWISLIGMNGGTTTNMTYGVDIDASGGADTESYGWGGMVVGWVNFNLMSLLLPSATLTALPVPCVIARDASTCTGTVNWTFANVTTAAVARDIVRISPLPIDQTIGGVPALPSGSDTSVTFARGANVFQAYYGPYPSYPIGLPLSRAIDCGPNDDFFAAPAGVCDQALPTISITANKTLVRSGDTVLISWTITPPAAQALDPSIICTVYGPGMPGVVLLSANDTSLPIKNGTTFKISCEHPGAPAVEDTVAVDVVPTTQEI